MPRPPVSTIADQLFYSTVYIEARAGSQAWTGTGFLVNYGINGAMVPVLVTNKHVLQGATIVHFTMPMGDTAGPLNRGTRIAVTDFSASTWVGHADLGVDIAAMFFAQVLDAMAANGAPAFYRAIPSDILMSQASAMELDSIESVTFFGYPAGLIDQSALLPIARRGQTATPIFNDYNGLPAFVIDASVFPGSSGSPVFLFDRGSYVDREGNLNVANRVFLLGVVAQVHTRIVGGRIEMVTNPTPMFDEPIDLGIVFKASAIQETVQALYAYRGETFPGSEATPEALL